MTNIWLDLQRALPPYLDTLLRDVDALLRAQEIPYLLTGAMAREILLYYGHKCPRGRETTDVDFGVTLPDWSAYEALKLALVGTGRFRKDALQEQRVIHVNQETTEETRVDLVPFGAIAGADGRLVWPPDGSHVMLVLGYAQALHGALRLRLDETCWVPVPSAAGLAILKLVAWADGGDVRGGRDAVDFLELLTRQEQVLTAEELFDDHPGVMETCNYRADEAGAWILGKQVAGQIDGHLEEIIHGAFQAKPRERLLAYALRGQPLSQGDDQEPQVEVLVEAFEKGLFQK